MAIFRSRSSAATTMVDGTAADSAQASTQQLLKKTRDEGRLAGLKEADTKLAEAKATQSKVDATVAAKKKELEDQLTPVIKALSSSLKDLENLEAQMIQASEADLVRLAIAIAERVVMHHIETDETWMKDVVAAARARLPDRQKVFIRMHPQDAELARQHIAGLQGQDAVSHFECIDDTGLQRGGCVLQSEGTTIDASVTGAVARLGDRLLQSAPKPDGFVHVNPNAQDDDE